jgi:hypothetical protein
MSGEILSWAGRMPSSQGIVTEPISEEARREMGFPPTSSKKTKGVNMSNGNGKKSTKGAGAAKATAKTAKKGKVDKAAKYQDQINQHAAAILRRHDEGASIKTLYKEFGIGKGLWCDLCYEVLHLAGRISTLKYASFVAGKHPGLTLDKRLIHPRPEQKKD